MNGKRNSSYSLIPILLNFYRHCDHTLKICTWLGYTPQIYLFIFFNLHLVIFRTFSHLESEVHVPVGGIVFHKTHFLVIPFSMKSLLANRKAPDGTPRSACLCPIKRTPGLYELKSFLLYEISPKLQ